MDKWECPTCDLYNDMTLERCNGCGALQSQSAGNVTSTIGSLLRNGGMSSFIDEPSLDIIPDKKMPETDTLPNLTTLTDISISDSIEFAPSGTINVQENLLIPTTAFHVTEEDGDFVHISTEAGFTMESSETVPLSDEALEKSPLGSGFTFGTIDTLVMPPIALNEHDPDISASRSLNSIAQDTSDFVVSNEVKDIHTKLISQDFPHPKPANPELNQHHDLISNTAPKPKAPAYPGLNTSIDMTLKPIQKPKPIAYPGLNKCINMASKLEPMPKSTACPVLSKNVDMTSKLEPKPKTVSYPGLNKSIDTASKLDPDSNSTVCPGFNKNVDLTSNLERMPKTTSYPGLNKNVDMTSRVKPKPKAVAYPGLNQSINMASKLEPKPKVAVDPGLIKNVNMTSKLEPKLNTVESKLQGKPTTPAFSELNKNVDMTSRIASRSTVASFGLDSATGTPLAFTATSNFMPIEAGVAVAKPSELSGNSFGGISSTSSPFGVFSEVKQTSIDPLSSNNLPKTTPIVPSSLTPLPPLQPKLATSNTESATVSDEEYRVYIQECRRLLDGIEDVYQVYDAIRTTSETISKVIEASHVTDYMTFTMDKLRIPDYVEELSINRHCLLTSTKESQEMHLV